MAVLTIDERTRARDLHELCMLAEAGKVRPTIDRVFTLAQGPEAMRYLERGHVQGKVVIAVAREPAEGSRM